jgi:hypothetical protein
MGDILTWAPAIAGGVLLAIIVGFGGLCIAAEILVRIDARKEGGP